MEDWSKYFQNVSLKVVGIGLTAFSRIMPAYFLPNYRIVCYKNSSDLSDINQMVPVVSIEKDFQGRVNHYNSLAILRYPEVVKFLRSLGSGTGIFVYKSSKAIEAVCRENGWQLIGNPAEIRDPWENKETFREAILKVGLKPIEGEAISIADFNIEKFKALQSKYGSRLVLKLPQFLTGGGLGNTFVEKEGDLARFWDKVNNLSSSTKLTRMVVERQIEGISPSITGCVTRFGTLAGRIQTQITDAPEVIDLKRGGGMFVGHDWSFDPYSPDIQNQAEEIAQKFGNYLAKHGYRGIFGIDLIIERGTNKVYPCECNPRYTGAFPAYSMLQMTQGEPTFDIFHLLEHLKLEYQINLGEIQNLYRRKKEGAHIVLFNKTSDWQEVGKTLKGGVYIFKADRLRFARKGVSFKDIHSSHGILLVDGIPLKGELLPPGSRILKIIFPGQIINADGRTLSKPTIKVIDRVYQELELAKVKPPVNIAQGAEEF